MISTKNKFFILLSLCLCMAGISMPVNALDSDKNQPATISADDVEFDFSTGVRIYRGNVKLDQGTVKLRADKLIVEYKDNVLQKATAFGQPAVFQQRPEDKTHDVIGKGKRLELDDINNITTLIDNASIFDGQKTASGQTIIYDMKNNKFKIKSGAVVSQAGKSETKSNLKNTSGRSKITISPKEREAAKEKVTKSE